MQIHCIPLLIIFFFLVITRDIFADAASSAAAFAARAAEKASKAAEQVRPSQEELSKVEDETSAREEEHPRVPPRAELKRQVQEKGRAYAEETRKRSYKAGDELQEYLKQKFPKQRRDAVINRFKKVIGDIQSNPDFQETAEFVVQLVSDYINQLKEAVVQEGRERKEGLIYDPHFEEAMLKTKVGFST